MSAPRELAILNTAARPAIDGAERQLVPLGHLLRSLLPAKSRPAKAPPVKQRLIIVGNGMVGQRFCERLVELGVTQRFAVTVLSEEATPAYDRVHLGDYLRGRSAQDLLLRDSAWFERHGIELS